jgi:cell division protein FtsB
MNRTASTILVVITLAAAVIGYSSLTLFTLDASAHAAQEQLAPALGSAQAQIEILEAEVAARERELDELVNALRGAVAERDEARALIPRQPLVEF